MAQTIQLKRSSVAGNLPTSSDLALGEIAINTADGAVYIKKGNDDIVAVADNDILHIDTSNGRVGIGTTSPSDLLHVKGTNGAIIIDGNGSNNTASIKFINDNERSRITSAYDSGGGGRLTFHTDTTGGSLVERMRINNAGNLMVGTTDTTVFNNSTGAGVVLGLDNSIQVARADDVPLLVNRQTSDGAIANFYKDGGIIGSIGTKSGDLIAGTGDTGIRFDDANNAIYAHNTSTNAYVDDAISLGFSGIRYKDLHLSNAANIGKEVSFTNTANSSGFDIGLVGGASDATAFIFQRANDSLNFGTNNTERMRITNAGNVGINNVSPDEKLHISGGGIKVDGEATIASGSGTGVFLDYASNVGRITALDQGTAWRSLRLNAADIQFYIAGGQQMHLNSSGNLIVGSGSPAFTNGSGIEIEKSNAATLRIQRLGGDAAEIFMDTSGFHVKDLSHGTMTFGTANTERMRLNSTGLGIGLGGNNPSATLHIADASNNSVTSLRLNSMFSVSGDGVVHWGSGAPSGGFGQLTWDTGKAYVRGQSGKALHLAGGGRANDIVISTAGAVTFNSAYTFPTSDGSAGQVLKTDGSGNLSFAADSGGGGSSTSISDADGDTKIQVEESSDEDIIRFDTAGSQRMMINNLGRVGINTTSLTADGLVIGTNNSNCEFDMVHTSGKRFRINNLSTGVLQFENKTDSTTVMSVDASGNFNAINGIRINGTEVISGGRNLANIGTISSGAITSTGTSTFGTVTSASYKVGASTVIDNSRNLINIGSITASGHIQQNNANEIRSKDTGGTVRTIMRVNSSNELEYGWSGNGKVKIMGGGSYTERFSIDTSANVLVGKTSSGLNTAGVEFASSGRSRFTRDGNNVAEFNRKTSDGSIVSFNKDATAVGTIGSEGGDSLFIQGGTSSGSGLLMHGTGAKVLPVQNGASVDATIDLGQSSRRFKDFYLSGNINVDGDIFGTGNFDIRSTGNIFNTYGNSSSVFFRTQDGTNRLTLDNSGNATFAGQVKAQSVLIDSGGIGPTDAEGQEFKYYLVAQGTDQNYKKVADITISTGLYKSLALRAVLESQGGNFGNTTVVDKTEYVCKFHRSDGTQDSADTAEISGQDPTFHNLRIVKTATGVYELQLRQNSNYRDAILHLEVLSTNGGTFTVTDGSVNGSTSGTITTPTSSDTKATYSFNKVDTAFLNVQQDITLPYGSINDSGTDLVIHGTNAVVLKTDGGTAITIPNNSTDINLGSGKLNFSRTSEAILLDSAHSKTKIGLYGGIGTGAEYIGTSANTVEISGTNVNLNGASGSGTANLKMGGTTVIDSSRNLTNIGTIASGNITLSNGSHLQTYTSSGDTGTGGVDLPRGGHITFYGNNANNHSIGSRNSAGNITDDLRISSYGAIYFDLDSNSNNSSSADFVIGRHGSGTGTMSTLVTISGEDGSFNGGAIVTSGNVQLTSNSNYVATRQILARDTNGLDIKTTNATTAISIDNSANITMPQNLTVTGDLTVNGATTTLNVATLDVEDKNITLNKGSGDTSGSADGAGITIQDAVNSSTDASLTWNAAGDKFIFSHKLRMFGTLELPDNVKLVAGDGEDLQIFHDGSNSYIQSGTGNFNLTTDGGNEFALTAVNNGAVSLFHNGVKTFETTSTGIKVDGPNGNVTIGALNTTGLHIYTDRDRFYFNKQISLIDNTLTSYDADLVLKRAGATQLTLGSGSATFAGAITTNDTIAFSPAQGNDLTLGNDGTYGTSGSGRYVTLGFGGTSNGSNRIFAHNTGSDGLYLNSGTGQGIFIRTNGSGTNKWHFKSNGDLAIGSGAGTTIIDASRNLTNIGTISSGAITSSGAISGTQVGVTNIVTNKVVKFNGSILDDSNITDTGSLITLGSNTNLDGRLTLTSSTTSTFAGTGYLNINANVGNVNTNGSHGLHIGWNKSNGGREINMIFDGGTSQADTEMIFTSTDGSTYTDIFQINGGGGVDIKSGSLLMNGTAVINSSRNLINLDTISANTLSTTNDTFTINTSTSTINSSTTTIGNNLSDDIRISGDATSSHLRIQNGVRGFSKNYADSSGWVKDTDGFSSQTGYYGGNFGSNGSNTEQSMDYATVPDGTQALAWTATGDTTSGADGGWNKTISGLRDDTTYMSVVYVRRNGSSTSGNFYHGCHGSHTLNLDGSANTNPYFQAIGISNLPQDVWCVSIGFIRANNNSSTAEDNVGGVYRCDTGQQIAGNTTFKMKDGSTFQQHRTYLYYSTTGTSSLSWFKPGFYEVNGSEPTVRELVNPGMNNTVGDTSGNPVIFGGVSNAANLTITGVMQANNGYKVGSTTRINSVGDGLFTSLYIGGTNVIDTSRNLTNIGTISSGAITTSGSITTGDDIVLPNNKDVIFKNASGSDDGTKITRATGNALRVKYTGNSLVFDALNDNQVSFRNSDDEEYVRLIPHNNPASSALDFFGDLRHNTTTLIDSSRNFKNIASLGVGGSAGTQYPGFFQSGQRYLIGIKNTTADSNYPWLVHDQQSSMATFAVHFNGVGDRMTLREDGNLSTSSHITSGGTITSSGQFTSNSGDASFRRAGSTTARIRIESGITRSDQAFHVGGLFTAAGGSGTGTHTHAKFGGTSGRELQLRTRSDIAGGQHSGCAEIFSADTEGDGGEIALTNNGGVRLFIDGDGKVGIGDTSPAQRLHVVSGSANIVARFESTDTAAIIQIKDSTGTAAIESRNDFRFKVSTSTEQMRLTTGGALHVEGDVTAFSTTVSDERLKDDVVSIDSALDKVMKLRGVEYIWNKGSREGQKDLGVIAQEVEKVLPEIVKDTEMVLLDEETYKTVDYEKLTAVLIEAVKEQQEQIEKLKEHSHPAKDMCEMKGYEELVARINKLENKNGNN